MSDQSGERGDRSFPCFPSWMSWVCSFVPASKCSHMQVSSDDIKAGARIKKVEMAGFAHKQEKWNRIETLQRIDRKFKPKLVAEVAKLDKTLKDICARREKVLTLSQTHSVISLCGNLIAKCPSIFLLPFQIGLNLTVKIWYTSSLLVPELRRVIWEGSWWSVGIKNCVTDQSLHRTSANRGKYWKFFSFHWTCDMWEENDGWGYDN